MMGKCSHQYDSLQNVPKKHHQLKYLRNLIIDGELKPT